MNEKYDDSLDSLLTRNLVTPPENFTDTVISKLSDQSTINVEKVASYRSARPLFWPTAAIATGTAVGVIQVISFIFGIWIPATVG